MKFILYGTSACHLCEAAEQQIDEVIKEHRTSNTLTFEKVDISLDDNLVSKYGLIIPVLRKVENGGEIRWPFTQDDIRALITS